MTNFVLVVLDDMRQEMMTAMPSVMKAAGSSAGVLFSDGFLVNPVCCASRASILTGDLSRTTGIYGNNPPVGGFSMFDDTETLPVALKESGYTNGIFGKYLNEYDDENYAYVAPGWDRWWAITSRGDQYYDYGVSVQGTFKRYGSEPNEYLTDVIARQAEDFVANAPEPFFAMVTPTAPHKQAVPAPRHKNTFNNLPPYNPASLNEKNVSDKPEWVQALKVMSDNRIKLQHKFRRNQYQTLLAADDMVDGLLTTLRNRGVLDDTMVIIMSDNGYLWGEHRAVAKSIPYLEATRMAFTVRYPGVLKKAGNQMVRNIDIAPTFAELAGVPFRSDGRSLVPSLLSGEPGPNHVYIEHGVPGPTNYCPAFTQIQKRDWTYTWYATGEDELYHVAVDPLQIHNIKDPHHPARVEMAETLRNEMTVLPPGMEIRP